MRVAIVASVLGRKDQMNDQRQEREKHQVKKLGFGCHRDLPSLLDRLELISPRLINKGKAYAKIEAILVSVLRSLCRVILKS
jgi:hypothetical protein